MRAKCLAWITQNLFPACSRAWQWVSKSSNRISFSGATDIPFTYIHVRAHTHTHTHTHAHTLSPVDTPFISKEKNIWRFLFRFLKPCMLSKIIRTHLPRNQDLFKHHFEYSTKNMPQVLCQFLLIPPFVKSKTKTWEHIQNVNRGYIWVIRLKGNFSFPFLCCLFVFSNLSSINLYYFSNI